MTKSEYNTARDISTARLEYLRSRGEHERNTVAWRDAVNEDMMLDLARESVTEDAPYVGMPCTINYLVDSKPATVVAASPSGKTISIWWMG